MAKLQQIKRADGTIVHSVNLPIDDVNMSKWEKGDNIMPELKEIDKGIFIFILSREKDIKEV